MKAEQKAAGENEQEGRKEPQSLSGKFLAVLPEREQRLVFELTEGQYKYNKSRAMMKAGYSRSTAYKQQTRVVDRPRVQQALLAIEYEREGSNWLTNDELRLIGVNVRSVRQLERRRHEAEAAVKARVEIARIFGRRRR